MQVKSIEVMAEVLRHNPTTAAVPLLALFARDTTVLYVVVLE